MFYILNGQLSKQTAINPSTDRGLQYGDGLFETMLFKNGEIEFYNDHLDRLKAGLTFFGFSLEELNPDKLLKETHYLLSENNIIGDARIKFMLWRKTGGFYTPTETGFNYSISVGNFDSTKLPSELNKLGIAKNFQLPKSPLGNFKTINSMYYVYACLLYTSPSPRDRG